MNKHSQHARESPGVTPQIGSAQSCRYVSWADRARGRSDCLRTANLTHNGICVNCVAPWPAWTPLIPATLDKDHIEEFGEHWHADRTQSSQHAFRHALASSLAVESMFAVGSASLASLSIMGKTRRTKKARQQLKRQSPLAASPRAADARTRSQRFGRVVGVTITAIGLLSAYVTVFGYFAPRITVQPLTTLDPKDPSAAVFAVTNQSPLDLHNVMIGCRFLNFYLQHTEEGILVTKRQGTEQRHAEIGAMYETVPFDGFYRTIGPQRTGTMKLPFPRGTGENLDIEIIVRYRPAWYFFGRKEVFRFVSETGKDGETHWLPNPDRGVDPYAPRS